VLEVLEGFKAAAAAQCAAEQAERDLGSKSAAAGAAGGREQGWRH